MRMNYFAAFAASITLIAGAATAEPDTDPAAGEDRGRPDTVP